MKVPILTQNEKKKQAISHFKLKLNDHHFVSLHQMTIGALQCEEGNKCLPKLASLCELLPKLASLYEAQHPALIASDNIQVKFLV